MENHIIEVEQDMGDSTVISVRVRKEIKDRLARIAKHADRSQSYLAAEAIEEFVAVQEWQIAGIEQAIVAADRGDLVADKAVGEWIETLGSANELAKPSV